MAPKRLNPMEEPPAASSDEEEHSSSAGGRESDGDDSSSGEEDDSPPAAPIQKTLPPPDPKTLTPASAHPQTSKSSDDEDSDDGESETDSDAPPSVNVKPIATKAMEKEAPKASKSISKPAPPPAKPTSKRPTAPEQEKREVKRTKKEDGSKETVKKSTSHHRLWSDDDEILILKGMIDFTKMRGVDPSTQSDEFHEFIKKSFPFDFSKNQLFEKIKRVRKKYKDNLKNGKKGTKPHEQKAFDLSEKLWGNGGVVLGLESTAASNGKARKSQNPKANKLALTSSSKLQPVPSADGNIQSKVTENVTELVPSQGLSNPSLLDEMEAELGGFEASILQRAKGVIDESKKAELERRSRKLRIAELELYLEKKALVGEQAKLLLSHYKSLDK